MKNKTQTLEEWINNYTNPLINRAKYLVSDKQDAEDIVQEVFIVAIESYDSFKADSKVLTWLMGILRNKVSDFYRKKYKKADNVSLDRFFDDSGGWKSNDNLLRDWTDSDSNLLADVDFRKSLNGCLESLPEKWRMIVILYYLDGKKSDVISQEFRISTTNLWKILQRSRLELRKCLDSKWFDENI